MCGIVGFTGDDPTQELLRRMNDSQYHRGPDDFGFFRSADGCVNLAMRRLSIVDLTGGHQPMSTADCRYTIVFNGEIFNAPELRSELRLLGASFRTDHSDTEVLLNFIAIFGIEQLARLNGMFAFALYDQVEGTITCARDHTGIKPLFYSLAGGRFSFASELKSLRGLPWIPDTLDYSSIYHYFSFQACPAPQTSLAEVHQLPPGYCLRFSLSTGGLQQSQYWKPTFSAPLKIGSNEIHYWLRQQLESAVGRWSMSDVPIACSLSGGIDSATIVSLLASQSSSPILTYTLGFSDAPDLDERELAREVSKKFGTKHEEIVVSVQDLLNDLDQMLLALDDPYAGGLPSWYVFREMAKSVKVAMTGTGGDELFGNYRKWLDYESRRRYLKTLVQRVRSGGRIKDWYSSPKGFIYRPFIFTDGWKEKHLFSEQFMLLLQTTSAMYVEKLYDAALAPRGAIQKLDFHFQLPNEFLLMTDRFSMAHSLEARTPFLDRQLIEGILSLSDADRTEKRDPKALLKKALADLIPTELLTAPKKGFVLPLQKWLRTTLLDSLYDLSEPRFLAKQGIFRANLRKTLIDPFLSNKLVSPQPVWTWWMFQRWWLLHRAS